MKNLIVILVCKSNKLTFIDSRTFNEFPTHYKLNQFSEDFQGNFRNTYFDFSANLECFNHKFISKTNNLTIINHHCNYVAK